jgi:glycosyltransferase involved in cell wall biosynthesis
VWYSPTIFWGPLVKWLKLKFNCKSYLILRDIFPDWAHDLGLIKNNLVLSLLQRVANFQYLNADVIGTQSPNNCLYLSKKLNNFSKNIEVLWNWSGPTSYAPCSIDLSKTKLKGKLCFVYAGNLGVAQGTDQIRILLRVASKYENIGFVFVGRGSEKLVLINRCKSENINNVLFYDEIDPSEVHDLYAQCHVGLVILDPGHTTHNIPGKFISYLQGGLKIFALVNSGNDLIALINQEKLGVAASGVDSTELDQLFSRLLKDIDLEYKFRAKSRNYYLSHFTSDKAATQIVNSLKL